MPKIDKETRAEAIEELKQLLLPGDTVYCILKSVSRSGMMRVITPVILRADVQRVNEAPSRGLYTGGGGPACVNLNERIMSRYYLGHLFTKVLGWSGDNDQGVKVAGAGMDMGFHMVSTVASILFDDYRQLEAKWL